MNDLPKLNIGICGLGYVGSAVMAAFVDKCSIYVYDTKLQNTKLEQLMVCPYIFVCIPTSNGECYDMGPIQQLMIDLTVLGYSGCVIVKSTTTVAFWREKIAGINEAGIPIFDVVYCPEFLTERNHIADFYNKQSHIVGSHSPKQAERIEQLYNKYGSFANVIATVHMTCPQAAYTKIITNTALAVKVALANEMHDTFNDLGLDSTTDWSTFISKVVANDPRLGESHWNVPGHTGYGYGGKCLPPAVDYMNENSDCYNRHEHGVIRGAAKYNHFLEESSNSACGD